MLNEEGMDWDLGQKESEREREIGSALCDRCCERAHFPGNVRVF